MKKLILLVASIIIAMTAFGCQKEENKLTVYAPDGAPALALVKAMDNLDIYDFNVTSADVIQTVVTGDKKADICVLPINLASKLLGNGKDCKMLGVLTHGNFYFISSKSEQVGVDTAQNLIGKTVGVVQLASFAGLSLKASLSNLGISYNELINGRQKDLNKVNLLPISATEIGTANVDLYLAPSPIADVKANALNYNFVGSLNDLYVGGDIPQAVVVCKTELISSNLDAVKQFVSNLYGVKNYLLNGDKEDICSTIKNNLERGLTPQFSSANLSSNIIERSCIYFTPSRECYSEVDIFLSKIKSVAPNSVGEISNDFYYLEIL